MKNQVTRTILLLAISVVLFGITLLFGPGARTLWFDILRGASGGFGLAGCVSFIILLVNEFKAGKRSA